MIVDDDHIVDAITTLQQISGTTIQAGVLDEGKLGTIAAVQEYGATIVAHNPTGFLWVPMKDGTYRKLRQVTIPARSFIRATVLAQSASWTNMAIDALNEAVAKNSATGFSTKIGQQMQRDIQEKMTTIQSPQNAPLTIANKQGGSPLINTGGLKNAVTYEVTR
ncbi:hypothetical protein ACRYI5_01245 [Furfurilactobacillus sp. WILCCON 0119]